MDAFEQLQLAAQPLVAALHHLLRAVDAALHGLKVGKHQLEIDRLHIARGVDAAVHVDDVLILKAAHHVHHSVHLTDVGEKFISKALSFRSSSN